MRIAALSWHSPLYNQNRYMREGKEFISDFGYNRLDFLARTYNPATGLFDQLDPMAEKFPWISPYAVFLNNPMKFVDSDGQVVKIWYKDDKGNNRAFVYNGSNAGSAPKNSFVSAVITAHQYNKANGARAGNGGGAPTVAAVERDDISINVMETPYESKFSEVAGGTIYWNPELGTESNGIVTSPATTFDHEADHAVDAKTNPEKHDQNRRTSDSQYTNKEEKRVITGSEQKTARANRETKSGQVTRTNHGGKSVITKGVTSNKVDLQKTKEYEERDKKRPMWTSD
jgi:RHS repeat-associated protein